MKLRVAAVAAVLIAALLSGCSKEAAEIPELLEPVGLRFDTAKVQRGDVRCITTFESAVSAPTTELYYEFDGVLGQMHVKMGQKVQEGDVLVSLDIKDAQERLDSIDDQISYLRKRNALRQEQLQLQIEICQTEINQMPIPYPSDTEAGQLKLQELERKQADLEQELDRQELELDQLRQKRRDLENTIEKSTLTAPFSGSVVYVNPILAGDQVKSLQTQVVLMDESVPILSGEFVSETYTSSCVEIYSIINGKRYELSPLPYDRDEYVSLVLSGQTVQSKFSIDSDASGISLGDFAVIFVVTRESKDTLYLPINTLYHDSKGNYVYKTADGLERERVQVETGLQTDAVVEILDGLSEGDAIYVKE